MLLVAAGCELGVVAEVELESDGNGEVALAFHLDDALLDELDAMGVDPTAEVAATVAEDEDWVLERSSDGDDLTVTLRRPVASPAEIGDTLRELTAGLAADDPALLVDIDVTLDGSGASQVSGTAGLRPPATAGATLDGEPYGPHGDELVALVERAVVPELAVTLPGRPTTTNADHVDDRTMRWELPLGAMREIDASAEPAPWWEANAPWLLIGAAALVVLLLVGGIWAARRRRRRRRAASSIGFVR